MGIAKNPKFRRPLSDIQIALLDRLFRFRFATADVLADDLGKNGRAAVYPRLVTLLDQGYIGRRYEDSYKLLGKPASYYLTANGLKLLKARGYDIDDTQIKSSYRKVGDPFVETCLRIYQIHNHLKYWHDAAHLSVKSELADYDFFPPDLPELYLSIDGDTTQRFLVYYLEAKSPAYVLTNWARRMKRHCQDGEWQAEGDPYPFVLCVCENGQLEKRIVKLLQRELARDETDIQFYTTSYDACMLAEKNDNAIWSDVNEPDMLLSLADI